MARRGLSGRGRGSHLSRPAETTRDSSFSILLLKCNMIAGALQLTLQSPGIRGHNTSRTQDAPSHRRRPHHLEELPSSYVLVTMHERILPPGYRSGQRKHIEVSRHAPSAEADAAGSPWLHLAILR